MATPETTESNIRTVLKTFENFHRLMENSTAFSKISKEDVKDYFKLAIFIEKATMNFKTKNCAENFISVLKSCNQGLFPVMVYNIDFYSHACDHVLFKFFTQKSLKPALVDVAVRMYTALLPKERLDNMLTDFILKSASCSSILDYTVSNKNVIDKNQLHAHSTLHTWTKQLDVGKGSEVQERITNMLSAYKIRSSLPLLIKILAIDNISEKENKIRKIILDMVLKKMIDRSILSKAFWLSLFKDIDKKDIAKVSALNQEFLLNLSRFIVYLGSMMVKSDNVWCGDPNLSICPEITFDEMLVLIRSLKDYSEPLKAYLNRIFRDANSNTGLPIWEEFEKLYIHEFL